MSSNPILPCPVCGKEGKIILCQTKEMSEKMMQEQQIAIMKSHMKVDQKGYQRWFYGYLTIVGIWALFHLFFKTDAALTGAVLLCIPYGILYFMSTYRLRKMLKEEQAYREAEKKKEEEENKKVLDEIEKLTSGDNVVSN